jgi:uncharacterized membrane protein
MKQNVGRRERILSVAAGSLLALLGLRRKGLGRWVLLLLGGSLIVRGARGQCAVYSALGVNTASKEQPKPSSVFVEDSVEVSVPATQAYAFWQDFTNLPKVFSHLEQVSEVEGGWRWTAKAPLGVELQWDVEKVYDKAPERIGWRSKAGAEVDSAGSVQFEPIGEGRTRVYVVLSYRPPLGSLGEAVSKLMGEHPAVQLKEDLERFRQQMEEAARSATA